jgi:hypothetical protein
VLHESTTCSSGNCIARSCYEHLFWRIGMILRTLYWEERQQMKYCPSWVTLRKPKVNQRKRKSLRKVLIVVWRVRLSIIVQWHQHWSLARELSVPHQVDCPCGVLPVPGLGLCERCSRSLGRRSQFAGRGNRSASEWHANEGNTENVRIA